jgi:hypothetical protein
MSELSQPNSGRSHCPAPSRRGIKKIPQISSDSPEATIWVSRTGAQANSSVTPAPTRAGGTGRFRRPFVPGPVMFIYWVLSQLPLCSPIIDGQNRHVETRRLSLRKEAMVQASGKEKSRRERRGAALLQSPAHRRAEIPAKVSVNARASVTAGLAKEVEAVTSMRR